MRLDARFLWIAGDVLFGGYLLVSLVLAVLTGQWSTSALDVVLLGVMALVSYRSLSTPHGFTKADRRLYREAGRLIGGMTVLRRRSVDRMATRNCLRPTDLPPANSLCRCLYGCRDLGLDVQPVQLAAAAVLVRVGDLQ